MRFVRLLLTTFGVLGALGLGATALVLSGHAVAYLPWSSGAIVRHALRRLEGHTQLQVVLQPALVSALEVVERPTQGVLLASLGKGHRWARTGKADSPNSSTRSVSSADELRQALQTAHAGAVIEIQPGTYRFSSNLHMRHAGTEKQPIVLRSAAPGDVLLEFAQLEGFLVDKPHWTFENLHIRGVCKAMHDCEHAFHIVGGASHIRLVNLLIEDFNAHIKVNGHGGLWPDHGVLMQSTLRNHAARQTTRPVTAFDLVGASHWQVLDNLVVNSVRAGSQAASYAMFMKGGGEGGLFARNVVICSPTDISREGARVGISFGGGLTGASVCRADGCKAFEHNQGKAINNVVAHCNDVGLDVNHSTNILLGHNTLINTAGVAVRGPPSSAQAYGNWLEGAIRARPGTSVTKEQNITGPIRHAMKDADQLDIRFEGSPTLVPRWGQVANDFCDRPRKDLTPPGALEVGPACW